MSNVILLAVLSAAVLHASWNAVIKVPGDALVRLGIINTTGALVALFVIPFVGLPDTASWPYLLGSVFVHSAYYISLLGAYRHGDLSQIYPIARGIAPVLVGSGAYLFAGESMSQIGVIGLLIASSGIISLAFSGNGKSFNMMPVSLGLITGLTIASYTILDGIGGRLSGNVVAYIAWLFLLDAIPLLLLVVWRRRNTLAVALHHSWKPGLLGGAFSFLAYSLVIWAMTYAPMAEVSALRETSVIFATLIGIFYLGEPLLWIRIFASCIVVAGILIMRLG